jgi:hypothetical protein
MLARDEGVMGFWYPDVAVYGETWKTLGIRRGKTEEHDVFCS